MAHNSSNEIVGNESVYTAFFEALSSSSYLLRNDPPRYTILAATESILAYSGFQKDDLIGKGLFNAFPSNPQDPSDTGKSNLQASLKLVSEQKKPHSLPMQRYDVMDEEGHYTEKYWRAENRPVISPQGEVTYIIHTTDDITKEVKAERTEEAHHALEKAYHQIEESQKALSNAHERIIDILENINDAFYAIDASFHFTYVNKRAAQLWGKESNSLIGQHYWTVFPKAVNSQSYHKHYEALKTNQAVHYETVSPLLGIWIDASIYPSKDGGLSVFFRDITERKAAEMVIKESEDRFRTMVNAVPQSIWITDAEGRTEFLNQHWCDYCGVPYSPTTAAEISANHIHPEDGPKVMEVFGRAMQTGEAWEIEQRNLSKEGEYRWFLNRGTPYKDPHTGKILKWFGISVDIHERKLAEQALLRSGEELEQKVQERTEELEKQKALIANILEASMNGIYALKAVRNAEGVITDFQYLFANINIVKALRLEVDEIIGASMLRLIPENKNNGFFDLFCKQLQTKKTYRGETHFTTQGIDSWYDYVVVPIDAQTLVVSIEDISEKKRVAMRMEDQRNLLDNILKNSSNGISVTEMIRDEIGNVIDARTIMANDAAVNYIGLPKEVFLSKTAVELDPDIINSTYGQTCLKTLQTGEPSLSQYYMEITGRWQELTISKMDDNHLIHIFTDITLIKEAQLQLERSVEDLKRSNQNLEEFAYAASHDLKEPVRKIQFFADRLRVELDGSLSDSQQNTFKRMENAATRMGSLIDDLLMYSHVSKGVEQAENIDLNQKVKNVLEDLELEIQEKCAVIKVEELPTINGHRRQLQQLFQNLISNAIKYNKPGVNPEVHITSHTVKGKDTPLSLQAEEGNKNYHLIEVKDNGIGFEQEDADRIFNVFTRLHGNAEYKGTGVGLSIARKVVENHNGFIWAESGSGDGATFKILLPAE